MKSGLSNLAIIIGLVLALADFGLSGLSSGSPGGAFPLLSFIFSFWIALPFLMLGGLRTFRHAPRLTLIYLIAEFAMVSWEFFNTYLRPDRSTAALGLLVVPFMCVAVNGVTWIVLRIRTSEIRR